MGSLRLLAIMLIIYLQFSSNHRQQEKIDAINIEEDEEIECDSKSQVCYKYNEKNSKTSANNFISNTIYLFYDVNPQEGFNLRRDVYMRVANLADYLNKKFPAKKWILVLPPWGDLYHWKSQHIEQKKLMWSSFFDIESLNKFTPVIELETLIRSCDQFTIDIIYYLELDQSDFKSNEFQQFRILNECSIRKYSKDKFGNIEGAFREFRDSVKASKLECLSFRGTSFKLADKLIDIHGQNLRSLMIDRAEVMLHQEYGHVDFWRCRRSMKIASHLKKKADEIRLKYLDSSDKMDNTVQINSDWTLNLVQRSENRGGPYICVHLRRGDFFKYRESNAVSLMNAASQITHALLKQNLTRVYLATDGTKEEITELKSYINGENLQVINYIPNEKELEELKDGGWAIVEQLICSHAKYFIGTKESTFSLRIQEEREILGFVPSSTFNCFCNEKPSQVCNTNKWLIQFE